MFMNELSGHTQNFTKCTFTTRNANSITLKHLNTQEWLLTKVYGRELPSNPGLSK